MPSEKEILGVDSPAKFIYSANPGFVEASAVFPALR